MNWRCRLGWHDWRHLASGWIDYFDFVARYECSRCHALHLCEEYENVRGPDGDVEFAPRPHGPYHPDPAVPVWDFAAEREAAR